MPWWDEMIHGSKTICPFDWGDWAREFYESVAAAWIKRVKCLQILAPITHSMRETATEQYDVNKVKYLTSFFYAHAVTHHMLNADHMLVWSQWSFNFNFNKDNRVDRVLWCVQPSSSQILNILVPSQPSALFHTCTIFYNQTANGEFCFGAITPCKSIKHSAALISLWASK